MSASEGGTLELPRKLNDLTYRESKIARDIVLGKSEWRAILDAGFNEFWAKHPDRFEPIHRIREHVKTLTAKVIEQGDADCLVTAHEIHEQVSDELRFDIGDLYNPLNPLDPRFNPGYAAGELLPVLLWPPIARQGGVVEIIDEPNMVHSDDEGGGSWDQKGRRIKIKTLPANRTKKQELAAKLKSVNALMDAKGPELHLHVHAEIVGKLQGALKRKERLIEAKGEVK